VTGTGACWEPGLAEVGCEWSSTVVQKYGVCY